MHRIPSLNHCTVGNHMFVQLKAYEHAETMHVIVEIIYELYKLQNTCRRCMLHAVRRQRCFFVAVGPGGQSCSWTARARKYKRRAQPHDEVLSTFPSEHFSQYYDYLDPHSRALPELVMHSLRAILQSLRSLP
jgi:hypothetical protein